MEIIVNSGVDNKAWIAFGKNGRPIIIDCSVPRGVVPEGKFVRLEHLNLALARIFMSNT